MRLAAFGCEVTEGFALVKGFLDTLRVLALVENGNHGGDVGFDDVVSSVVTVVQYHTAEMFVFRRENLGVELNLVKSVVQKVLEERFSIKMPCVVVRIGGLKVTSYNVEGFDWLIFHCFNEARRYSSARLMRLILPAL